MTIENWTVYFDGGIPGGVPTYGVIITDSTGRVIHTLYGLCNYHVQTNNVAEWVALKNALLFCYGLISCGDTLQIFGDSELVIKQLLGEYQVNADHLKPLHKLCRELLTKFKDCGVVVDAQWHKREENRKADYLTGLAYKIYHGDTATAKPRGR